MKTLTKYQTLINILDRIRKEAPSSFKKYYPLEEDIEKVNQARSRAYIHLFLKVKYGLLDFVKREHIVTDGSNDGGIDAYYINSDTKKLIFIQSKFRTNKDNFSEKEITFDEILKMDTDRITDGETTYEDGTKYCGKILQLQREMQDVPDIGRYSYEVVILANMKDNIKQSTLKKLSGGFPVEVINFEKAFTDLVFPVISGTYYNEKELYITLNVTNTSSSSARVGYNVNTEFKECDISLVFVPTFEIGKILYKYKNSILKFNPRSYLELANNDVNKMIADTITNKSTNEFSLFNNGITMLSEGTDFNEKVGKKGQAQVIVTHPQILNGGQTAFTLSRLYEDVLKGEKPKDIFKDKEVLLKIITFNVEPSDNEKDRLNLIENISKATNSQTPVNEADRRSNDRIQVELQNKIFNNFGFYYERKRGEFANGVREGYILRSQLIDRDVFLRLCMACDFMSSKARRSSSKEIFKEDNFTATLNDVNRYKEYYFAYRCYSILVDTEKIFSKDENNKYGTINYGQALRYGKYSVISVCNAHSAKKDVDEAESIVQSILKKWLKFEEFAIKKGTNRAYFPIHIDSETEEKSQELNFTGYYKGRTIDSNLSEFFEIE